jgi:hypothetical protein
LNRFLQSLSKWCHPVDLEIIFIRLQGICCLLRWPLLQLRYRILLRLHLRCCRLAGAHRLLVRVWLLIRRVLIIRRMPS